MAGKSKEEVSINFHSHEPAWLSRYMGPESAFKAQQANQYPLAKQEPAWLSSSEGTDTVFKV